MIQQWLIYHSPLFSSHKTWRRIYTGYTEGRCVITLGTDNRVESNAEWIRERWGRKFLGEHNYAVVGMSPADRGGMSDEGWAGVSEEGGEALLTILDSRIDDQVLGEDNSRQREFFFLWRILDMTFYRICFNLGWRVYDIRRCIPELGSKFIFSSFAISWVKHRFSSLYAIAHHLFFLACGKRVTQKIKNFVRKLKLVHSIYKSSRVIATNRHLRLTSNGDTIWVLLTRHQVSTHRKSDYIALHVSEDQEHSRMDTSKIIATVSFP